MLKIMFLNTKCNQLLLLEHLLGKAIESMSANITVLVIAKQLRYQSTYFAVKY